MEAINELKTGKSPSRDQISAELLKKCKTNKEFVNLLYTLFNKLFNESTFPSSWAEGVIVPIFKKVNEMTQITTEVLRYSVY